MGSNKKTNDFLKECMADSLIKLMGIKEYDKITIKEIAETAGVNRSTWFRNFEDKQDALIFKLIKLWYRFGQDRGIDENTEYTLNNVLDFFEFNYNNRDLLDLLYKEKLEVLIYEAFYRIMYSQFEGEGSEQYENRFFAMGMFGLLMEWKKRNYRESPADMARLFIKIIKK